MKRTAPKRKARRETRVEMQRPKGHPTAWERAAAALDEIEYAWIEESYTRLAKRDT